MYLNKYNLTQIQCYVVNNVIDKILSINKQESINKKEKYLYFIKDNIGDIKIGVSFNVQNRIKKFKKEVQIIKVLPRCGKFENRLHKIFNYCNINYKVKFDGYTEWFRPDKDLLTFINKVDKDNIEKEIKNYESKRKR